MLGRERSIGSSNGATRLTLDIILFLFAESSYIYLLKVITLQNVLNPSFQWYRSTMYSRLGRGAVREFSCLVCLMDGY